MLRLACLALVVIGVAGPSHAAFSGLTIIPTADMLPAGHVCVDYLAYSPRRLGGTLEGAYLNTQSGVGNRAEIGLDLDFSENPPTGALFNGKLSLRPLESGVGIAAGVCNAGDNLRPFSYLVATRPMSDRLRLHLGAQQTPDQQTEGFGGVEYGLNERVWVWAECLAGDENASAVTLYYQFTDQWGIGLSLQRPNDGESDDMIVIDIGCVRPTE